MPRSSKNPEIQELTSKLEKLLKKQTTYRRCLRDTSELDVEISNLQDEIAKLSKQQDKAIKPKEPSSTDSVRKNTPMVLLPPVTFDGIRIRPDGQYYSYIFPCEITSSSMKWRYHFIENGVGEWSDPYTNKEKCHADLKLRIEKYYVQESIDNPSSS